MIWHHDSSSAENISCNVAPFFYYHSVVMRQATFFNFTGNIQTHEWLLKMHIMYSSIQIKINLLLLVFLTLNLKRIDSLLRQCFKYVFSNVLRNEAITLHFLPVNYMWTRSKPYRTHTLRYEIPNFCFEWKYFLARRRGRSDIDPLKS